MFPLHFKPKRNWIVFPLHFTLKRKGIMPPLNFNFKKNWIMFALRFTLKRGWLMVPPITLKIKRKAYKTAAGYGQEQGIRARGRSLNLCTLQGLNDGPSALNRDWILSPLHLNLGVRIVLLPSSCFGMPQYLTSSRTGILKQEESPGYVPLKIPQSSRTNGFAINDDVLSFLLGRRSSPGADRVQLNVLEPTCV